MDRETRLLQLGLIGLAYTEEWDNVAKLPKGSEVANND